MRILLIRHGLTKGNEEKRYIGGRTDEGLSERGIEMLQQFSYEKLVENQEYVLFSSPMKRCMESCEVLFPGKYYVNCEDFKEIDFGVFENKNYEELNGRKDYQNWIDSGGKLDYPEGEKLSDFMNRCVCEFQKVLRTLVEQSCECGVIVCHGGTIMAIMNFLTKEDYYSFQIKNGQGYLLELKLEGEKVGQISYHSI